MTITISADDRQTAYTELTAACGETVYVRLSTDPIVAAEMIVAFTTLNCARRVCRQTQPKLPIRNITWADVNRG